MILGVISDIHSNFEALDAVLKALTSRGVGGYICCGDIVGYGPSPEEVVDRLSALPNLHAVSGNHDLAVVGKMEARWFNNHAQAAIEWTRRRLSAGARRFLENLPQRVDAPTFTLVHGSPRDPAEEYLITRRQFLDNAPHVKTSPCFVGHSHITCAFGGDPADPSAVQSRLLGDGQKIRIPSGVPWAINPGSVGQPRDCDSRASCGVYDDEKREFGIVRVPYDVPSVQRKMSDAGLPEFLAQRLAFGR